jgi:hypothetical protein
LQEDVIQEGRDEDDLNFEDGTGRQPLQKKTTMLLLLLMMMMMMMVVVVVV